MTDRGPDWRTRWVARLGVALVWVLARTWRVRYVHAERLSEEARGGGPILYVVWHGQLLPQLWAHRRRNISVLISEHRDGEIIARIARSIGYRTVRGSTTRGANRALVAMVKELEAGYDVAITPDGPRGPNHSFAAGALLVAQRSGRPLAPVGAHASRAWRFRSWDRFLLPKPFARVTIAYGELMPAPEGSPREMAEKTSPYADAIHAAIEAAGRDGGAPHR